MVGAVHHIVSDKWSSEIFMRELTTLYEAFLAGRPSPLEDLPISYDEFARQEKNWLRGEVLERELDYWRQRLAPPRPELGLPTDHPRPAVASYQGERESTTFSVALTTSIEQLCRDERVTLYMGFLAAFGVLLHRYTGQDDLIVGAPIANRTRRETERLIGFFVNTLPMRLDLSGPLTFRELLARVKDVAFGAYEHQSLPFEKLVEELNPERSLSRNPIFQTLLNFHNVPDTAGAGVTAGPLRMRRRAVSTHTAKFDLTLTLRRAAEGLRVSAEYATDLFEAETIRRLLGHYEQLLTSAATDPDQRISALPMLTRAERTSLPTETRATETAVTDSPVHALIAQQVRRRPTAIAVTTPDAKLTYNELERQSNRLARHLMAQGVETGDLVGICLPRSAQMVVAMLGVLKTGAAYVPLDPAFPTERLAFMASDAHVDLVVSHSVVADRVVGCSTRVVMLDTEAPALHAHESDPIGRVVRSSDLAYVIYTSGSTGQPKGVRVSHRSVVNFLTSMRDTPGLTADDVLLAVTTLSFDISVLEIFLPLLVGARVCVVDAPTAADGEQLAAAIESSGATIMQATPATWQLLFETGWGGASQLRVLCGGEALPPALARRLLACVSSVWNMYGPTETTVWSTCGEVVDADRPITCGRPIANTQIHVLDCEMQTVPIGVPGELYIGGAGVADGYLGRPELTAERFVPDPFRGDGHGRLYRTGDLGRWRSDGQLELFGRVDRQVKVRGFRIEPGEVETSLARHAAIKTCVVDAWRGDGGDVRLIAYVVYHPHDELTVSEVRQFLRTTVPDYMVPGLVVALPSIPLTPNGKVNRHALPDPFDSVDAPAVRSPPSSAAEKIVASVWQALLGVECVGRDDNFFELGGHSLLSIRAVYAVEKRVGYRLDPRKMFFQTLEQVAAALPNPPHR